MLYFLRKTRGPGGAFFEKNGKKQKNAEKIEKMQENDEKNRKITLEKHRNSGASGQHSMRAAKQRSSRAAEQ